ncbi:hypothetical protein [Candidatus Ichthyocystis sparus]|uniref:hypothetical protein n=1 Tax=Candidatus Ichthyocystis sparus TaxID=1561004 RepID=UPI0011465A61|nr:hypothetical protein [Candidatus Ichthyocystis sparus]
MILPIGVCLLANHCVGRWYQSGRTNQGRRARKKYRRTTIRVIVSDKRIYGASGGDSSSETDEPITGGDKSPLGAIGQEDEGKAGKSEGKDGGSGSGASLASPGGPGSSRELGARQKVGHGGGKGKHRKREDDIWQNPTRKSAKSLRGQGQFLAAVKSGGSTAPAKKDTRDKTVVVRLEGPRSRGRPEGTAHRRSVGRKAVTDPTTWGAAEVAIQFFFFVPPLLVFIYDLLTLERTDNSSSNQASGFITGLGWGKLVRYALLNLVILLILLAVLLSVMSGRSTGKNKKP